MLVPDITDEVLLLNIKVSSYSRKIGSFCFVFMHVGFMYFPFIFQFIIRFKGFSKWSP